MGNGVTLFMVIIERGFGGTRLYDCSPREEIEKDSSSPKYVFDSCAEL